MNCGPTSICFCKLRQGQYACCHVTMLSSFSLRLTMQREGYPNMLHGSTLQQDAETGDAETANPIRPGCVTGPHARHACALKRTHQSARLAVGHSLGPQTPVVHFDLLSP